jgi:hypothetical protein
MHEIRKTCTSCNHFKSETCLKDIVQSTVQTDRAQLVEDGTIEGILSETITDIDLTGFFNFLKSMTLSNAAIKNIKIVLAEYLSQKREKQIESSVDSIAYLLKISEIKTKLKIKNPSEFYCCHWK